MWCFACWPGPGESRSLNVTNSSCIFAAKRLTRSAFPPSLHTTLFYQAGVVRLSCSLFSSDHFWNNSVSPKAITIMGVSAILTLPRIFSMVDRPCSCVELWEKCVVTEVGSVGSDCHSGILCALCSIKWSMQFTRWTVPWSREDLHSNSALRAVWLQQAQQLCQCEALSRGCSCIHVCSGIAVSICTKLRSLRLWLWRVHFEWQHLARCRKIWPSLSSLFSPGLGLPPILSAWALVQLPWATSETRYGLKLLTYGEV